MKGQLIWKLYMSHHTGCPCRAALAQPSDTILAAGLYAGIHRYQVGALLDFAALLEKKGGHQYKQPFTAYNFFTCTHQERT
jgi:hypothetical protein